MSSAFRFSFTLILMLLPVVVLGQRQSPRLVVNLPQGGFAAFTIEATPLEKNQTSQTSRNASLPITPRVVREGSVVHRMLVDQQGRLLFAYDLIITELDAPKRFKVSARPAAPGFDRRLRIQHPNAFQGVSESRVAPPTFSAESGQQEIDDGETLALDLLVNEPLGLKVVDYVTVASQRWLLAPRRPAQPPRDFGLSNVELAVQNYELVIDGLPVLSTSSRRNCVGALIWFSLPGQGRFIFSLVPYEGFDFRKVGIIENNTISFMWEGVQHEWISREPILGSGGAWHLWVLYEADYVDLFDPGPRTKDHKTRTAHLYPYPTGITIPLEKKRDNTAWKGKNNEPPQPVWINIGGAKRIEDLLPKK